MYIADVGHEIHICNITVLTTEIERLY